MGNRRRNIVALYPIFPSKDSVRKYLLLHQTGNLVMVIAVQVDCVLTYSNPCWLAGHLNVGLFANAAIKTLCYCCFWVLVFKKIFCSGRRFFRVLLNPVLSEAEEGETERERGRTLFNDCTVECKGSKFVACLGNGAGNDTNRGS
jgi:hypothetical protein